jgi:AraC-like DNA-binding protein
MDGAPDDFGILKFSTSEFPMANRLDYWREILSRKLLHVAVDPVKQVPFSANARLRILPGLRVGSGSIGSSNNSRSRRIVANDNDDFMLMVNLSGALTASQRGRDVALGPGDAYLMTCAEPGTYQRALGGRLLCVRLPSAALLPNVTNLYDRVARPISRGDDALGLLTGYAAMLEVDKPIHSPELRQLIVSHVYDLVSLVLGATGDPAYEASQRGLKAARFSAIKADIAANLSERDTSLATVAARHHVTPRYLQRLFQAEGTTLTAFLLEQRLKRIYTLLANSKLRSVGVSALALDCGFGDISDFNRRFRQRFGASPSEIRAQAAAPRDGGA